VGLYILLLSALTLHVSLELMGQLLNLTLIHRKDILEFIKQFQFLEFSVQVINHSAENIDRARNFGINQFLVHGTAVSICLFNTFSSVSLTHLIFVLLVGLLTLLCLNKLEVNVLELWQAGNSVFFVLTRALLLESVITDPQHFKLVLKLA
jgi:hypothetical protein